MLLTNYDKFVFSLDSVVPIATTVKYIAFLSFLLLSSTLCGAERHIDFESPPSTSSLDEDGMEEIVVSGERDNTAEALRRIYLVHRKGMFLYGQGKYEEALPHLVKAARYGYKDSQARLAHLYLHGLGGLDRSDITGIAWLGTAAHGETTPIIKRRYDELITAVPARHMKSVKQLVSEYVAKYGNIEQTVECDLAKHASSLISKNRCYFKYEFAVLSALEIAEMQDYYKDQIIPPDQYSSFSGLDNFRGNIEVPQPQQSDN